MKYDKYNWFYGATIEGMQAEALLRRVEKDGCFLVRISSTKMYYVLTMFCDDYSPKVLHYHIYQTTSGKFHFETQSDHYATLPDLIEHHTKCKHNLPCLLTCTPKGPLVATDREQPKKPTPIPLATSTKKLRWNIVASASQEKRNGVIVKQTCYCKFQIKSSDLQIIKKIGQGSYGVVHLGKLHRLITVAVKLMIPGTMSEDLFIKEAQVMTELKHPHIVRLCGICTSQRPIAIVTEYMKHGSLLQYLIKHKAALIQKPLTFRNICAQVASGMAYLENENFVHRDLACRNCLVGECGAVKVADFGMSKFMTGSDYKGNSKSSIPVYTVPPEVIATRVFSSKSDVWAFGLLMWEVFMCGEAPYGNLDSKQVMQYVEKGYILDHPETASDEDYDMMTRCWAYKPEKRPTFEKLEVQLRKMLK